MLSKPCACSLSFCCERYDSCPSPAHDGPSRAAERRTAKRGVRCDSEGPGVRRSVAEWSSKPRRSWLSRREGNARRRFHGARLSSLPNDPRVDIRVEVGGAGVELQLKVGSARYIQASVRAVDENVTLLVPSDLLDAGRGRAVSRVVVADVGFSTPTSADLLMDTERLLDRIDGSLPVASAADLAGRALVDGLADGAIAVALDLGDAATEQAR